MEVKLTVRIAEAIKSGELPGDQLSIICRDVLDNLDTPQTKEDYVAMLADLASRYPIFSSIQEAENKQQEAVQNVDTMFARNPTSQ